MKVDEFVRIYDVGDALLRYIGTDDFARATSHLSLEAQSSFMSGIGMAGVLIMANCPKYYGADTKERDDIIERLQKENERLMSELSQEKEVKNERELERMEEAARNGDVYL